MSTIKHVNRITRCPNNYSYAKHVNWIIKCISHNTYETHVNRITRSPTITITKMFKDHVMWDHYLNESLFRTGRGPLRKGHYGKSDLISNKYGTCLIGVDRVIVCVHWRHLVLEKYLGVILFQKSTMESSCFRKSTMESSCFRKVSWSHLILEKYHGVILF